ncbi:hypothetical protein LPJ78_001732 [Coemansia sp. RSA 989]|nr:hypothetical protein LPJ78_001732 [Coemansia sp. RSA 989]
MKGGVLGKNGKVTSCELAVIDNKAAIAAASCLDYTSGTTLDKESKYIAYLDKGNDGVQGAYFVDTITVHPKFNPKNYVNNIAILEFNKDSDVSMQNQIAPVGPGYSWNETAYVRVVLNNTNMENMQFNYREGSDKQDDTCTELSGMYTVNMDDMMCTQYLIASVVDSQTCDVPMGTVYGYAHNGKAYTIGLYSYTSLYQGDSLCKSSQERSYYTALYNYLGFIHKTLNRDIKIDSSFFDKNISDFKSDYSMVDRDFSDETVKSTTIISGNFYGKDDSSISTSSGDSSDSDSASDSNINDSSEGQSNPHQSSSEEVVSKEEQTSSEGLSNTQVVIIAVCVPVGVVIIAFILLIIFWRRYQHRKHGIDPVEQTGYQEAIEADIGGAVVPALSSRNLIDNKAAVVAASCLDFVLSNTLDSKTEYAVYLDGGNDNIRGAYKVENITVHPDYNPDNYANNLAILEFNSNSNVTMQNNIAPVESDYKWIEKTYTRDNNKAYIISIFSYSVNIGTDPCNDDRSYSYFTVLAPYLGFIKKTLNRDIKTDESFFKVNVDSFDPSFKMTEANAVNSDESSNAKIVTGNIFTGPDTPDGPPVESNDSNEASDSSAAGNSGASSDDNNSNGDSGLSKQNSIILAACVSAGGVAIIAITSLLLWRRYLRKKRAIDLVRERQYQEAMSVEIGGAAVPALSSCNQQVQASAETNAEEDAILEFRYVSGADRSNDIEVHHADLPPIYEEAVNPPPISSSKNDKKPKKE